MAEGYIQGREEVTASFVSDKIDSYKIIFNNGVVSIYVLGKHSQTINNNDVLLTFPQSYAPPQVVINPIYNTGGTDTGGTSWVVESGNVVALTSTPITSRIMYSQTYSR